MKRVVVLGGTFNPITNEHLNIVKKVLHKLDLDEAYFLIAKNPRWKDTLDVKHRLKMLLLALNDYPNYHILDIELKSDAETNYTYDSMLEFKKDDMEIYYIIGSDQLNQLDKWYHIDDLCELVNFVLVHRDGYEDNQDFIKKYHVLDLNIKGSEVSSTKIRQYISDDAPKCVLDYIYQNHLYIDDSLKYRLKEKRYLHSKSVASLAYDIAKSNGLDENKAYLAGLIHDVAKYMSNEELTQIMQEKYPMEMHRNINIWHQYVGSEVIQDLYHIKDKDIIEAVRYHTTAKLNLGQLGKIIFVSDKLDPLRGYDSSKLIDICKENIDIGYNLCLMDNRDYLARKKVKVDEESKKIFMEAIKENELLLLKEIYKALDEKKATDIEIIDMRQHSADFSYFIIASADNARLSKSLAYEVEDTLAKFDYPIKHIEGKNDDEWVLVDANEYIVHIFVKDARKKYNLEKLYADLDRVTFENE